jgi:hypothetical protein
MKKLLIVAAITGTLGIVLAACGSSPAPQAQASKSASAGAAPGGAATSGALPSDATALVRASAQRMSASGLTMHFAGTIDETWTSNGKGGSDSGTDEGDALMPAAMRQNFTFTQDGVTDKAETLTADGKTFYLRSAGDTSWKTMTAAEFGGYFTPAKDMTAYLDAATKVVEAGAVAEGGVQCRVVVITLDFAKLSQNDSDFEMASVLVDSMGITSEQASAAVRGAQATVKLWIGQQDGLVRREDDHFVFTTNQGQYEQLATEQYSGFGEKLAQPIIAPTGATS